MIDFNNHNELLVRIQQLSNSDTKSLQGKALKAAEELGELSRKILPYDNAFATTHRFVTPIEILEESADLILSALSIPYSLGFSTDDIFRMLEKKSQKWARLQVAATNGTFPLPFEIHITVRTSADMIPEFRRVCGVLGVKPIVLELQTSQQTILDLMTSSVFKSDNRGVYEEMVRIRSGLEAAGFHVVREKVEAPPNHPAAPQETGSPIASKTQYFESHINVRVPACDVDSEGFLRRLAEEFGCHLSRNKFKIDADGSYNQMVTLRAYEGGRSEFESRVREITNKIEIHGLVTEKVVTEFAVYDTNTGHDSTWTAQS